MDEGIGFLDGVNLEAEDTQEDTQAHVGLE